MRRRLLPTILVMAWLASAGDSTDPEAKFIAARGRYWAFQPVVRPPAPAISDPWTRTPIDAFILTGLRAKNISPSPSADRTQLIRRLTFDLIGLPPTPEEIDAFARDRSPNAYEIVVDRLLASPHYAERGALKRLDWRRNRDRPGLRPDADRPPATRTRDQ